MRMFGSFRNQHQHADAYVDGELRGAQLERFERHLESCDRCQAVVAQARTVRAAISALPPLEAPRSFAITPEMASSARPVRLRAATPAYLTFARAGAALSVAAFATVAAISALDSSGNDTVGSSGDDDDSVELSAAEAPETQTAQYDAAGSGPPATVPPTPKLAPATTSGGSASGDDIQPLTSPTSAPPLTGSAPTPVASPAPPEAGLPVTDDASRSSVETDDAFDTSFSPLPESAEEDDGGSNGALLGVGALAAAAIVALGVLEVARRRRA